MCRYRFSASSITVRLGEYTFDETDNTGNHDYKVQSIQKHANYNTTTFVNDIAILTLPRAAEFNDDVWPICLPSPGPLYVDEVATVTGAERSYCSELLYHFVVMTCIISNA